MADALEPFRAAIRDLNRRLEAAEKHNAELDEVNVSLIKLVEDLYADVTKINETLWPKSHTMPPEDLADAVYKATKDDPVREFAKSSNDGLDFFRRYAEQMKDLD